MLDSPLGDGSSASRPRFAGFGPRAVRARSLELFGTRRHYNRTYVSSQRTSRRTMRDMSDEPDSLIVGAPFMGAWATPATASLGADEFQSMLVDVLPTAYGYAVRLTRNRGDAEDLVEDAALRAFRAMEPFEPSTNFKAWI